MAPFSFYSKFNDEFVALCQKYGFQNGQFNVSSDNESCFQQTFIEHTSKQDEFEVRKRTFQCLIPLLMNGYDNLVKGEIDLVRVVMEEAEKHRRIRKEFSEIEEEDCPEATDEEIEEMRQFVADIKDADALTTIYMDKNDFELTKHMARHFRDKRGFSQEEALRKAINCWADRALNRLDLAKLDLEDPCTANIIKRNIELRKKVRDTKDEREKDKVLKFHLGEPMEWK